MVLEEKQIQEKILEKFGYKEGVLVPQGIILNLFQDSGISKLLVPTQITYGPSSLLIFSIVLFNPQLPQPFICTKPAGSFRKPI